MKQFSDEECCHFQFYVKWDFIGIYLHYGVGSGFLNSHPKSISDDMLFSSRLICNAKQDVLRKLGHSYTNCCTSVPAGTTINFTRECSLVLVLLTMRRGIFFSSFTADHSTPQLQSTKMRLCHCPNGHQMLFFAC